MKLDLLLTSVKPFCGDAYSRRQAECLDQMRRVARNVLVFNQEADLGDKKDVDLIRLAGNPPKIKEMLAFANLASDGTIGIVNGDILLTSDVIRAKEIGKKLGNVWAATSFRWEDNQVKGQGLDLFLFSGRVSRELEKVCPDFLTLGRAQWDNWMNGWLRLHLKPHCYFDMTDWRCVLHEDHERQAGRLSNYTAEQSTKLLHDVSCEGIPKTKYAI